MKKILKSFFALSFILIACSCITYYVSNYALVTQRIALDTGKVEVTVYPGTYYDIELPFRSGLGEFSDLSLVLEGDFPFGVELKTAEFDLFPELYAGTYPARIAIPSSVRPGKYSGYLILGSKNKNVPTASMDVKPLKKIKLILHVSEYDATTIPDQYSDALSERVFTSKSGDTSVNDELNVYVKDTVADPDTVIKKIAKEQNGVIVGKGVFGYDFFLKFNVDNHKDLLKRAEDIKKMYPEVDDAFPTVMFNPKKVLSVIPNDSKYKQQDAWTKKYSEMPKENWGLRYISAPTAWDITTGDSNVKLAILDGDFFYRHADLRDNVAERVGFATQEFGGHGTHVAGIAAAKGNNSIGISGVCWECELYLNDYHGIHDDLTSAEKLRKAMKGAVDSGARVVNMSLQFYHNNDCSFKVDRESQDIIDSYNKTFGEGIKYGLQDHQVLWVIAAGNECRDVRYATPASLVTLYPENVLVVAAVDPSGNLANFSNRGSKVSVAAPGVDILSTIQSVSDCTNSKILQIECQFIGSDYKYRSGTSQATPFVTGLAGLIWSEHPQFSAAQVKNCITKSADKVVRGSIFKVINAELAVKCQLPEEAVVHPIAPNPSHIALPGTAIAPISSQDEVNHTTIDLLRNLQGHSDRILFKAVLVNNQKSIFVLDSVNNKIYKTHDLGSNWDTGVDLPQTIDGEYAWDVSPSNPNIIYFSTMVQNDRLDLFRYNRYVSHLWKSTDGGVSWIKLENAVKSKLITPLTVPQDDSLVYIVESGEGAHVSRDGGQSWNTIFSGYKGGIAFPVYNAYVCQQSPKYFYFTRLSQSPLYSFGVSTDSGNSYYTPSTYPVSINNWMADERLFISPNDCNSLYRAEGTFFMQSHDAGKNWTTLYECNCEALAVFEQSDGTILLVTERRTTWVSDDNGTTFHEVVLPFKTYFKNVWNDPDSWITYNNTNELFLVTMDIKKVIK